MAEDYLLALVEVTVPRIIKGTRGRINLKISDFNGKDVGLSDFDKIDLLLKNYPEKDTSITRECFMSPSDKSKCYFDFTEAESAGWLSSPYFAQFQFTTFDRDQSVVTTSTGYTPSISTMNIKTCTVDFIVGEVVTGDISGATALVSSYESYGGGLGQFELVNVVGTFSDSEAIAGDQGGAAVVVVGITETEYLEDRFADDSSDYVALGVGVGDVIEIDSVRYIVSGYDELVTSWLILESNQASPGTSITYEILTYSVDDSARTELSKTLEFALYVEDSLS